MNTFTAQELALLTEKQKPTIKLLEELQEGLVALNKAWDEGIQNALSAGTLKPAKKIIDLSVLIESGIDCEFKDLDADSWVIGKLHDLPADHDGFFKFWKRQDNTGCWYDKCRPRMNHIHAIDVEDDEEAGNIVENLTTAGFLLRFDTIHCIDRVVLLLSDFGKAEGYVMPWEVSDE
jgi:hypothetical protein